MPSLLEELKMSLKKQKEDAERGGRSFGFVFEFFEMEILNYEKQKEKLQEQEEGRDKEEAIFNDQIMQSVVIRGKRGKGVKSLRSKGTAKKKNSLKKKYNSKEKQKRKLQKGKLEREGYKKRDEKKGGKIERERTYEGQKQEIKKKGKCTRIKGICSARKHRDNG